VDGVGELHIFHAGFEVGQFDRLEAPDGVDEFLLDAPSALLVGRDFDFLQVGVASPAAVEAVVAEVQRALGADNADTDGIAGH